MVSRLWTIAIALGLSAFAIVQAARAETVILHPPDGFETTSESELTLVDVYLSDRFIAETPARFDSDEITFSDVEGLISVLPDIKDPERVERALGTAMDLHSELACGSVLATGACGFVHADVVAVIFDVARFRVDLFINPRFTYERDPRFKYLPPPTKSPGLLTRLNSRSIYDFDRSMLAGTHNLRTVAGYGRWAGRAEFVTDLEKTSLVRNLYAERSGREHAMSAGLFPRQTESSLAQTEQLLGVRLATSSKTRLDRARLGASILDISVNQSAIVEIQRDGDILDVQRVEPEQRQLDTSRLPQGTYSVELEIREGDQVRTERREFSSFGSLPPQEAPQWFFELGQAVPFNTPNIAALKDGTAILAFGRHQRISNSWALRASGAMTSEKSHAEIGAQVASANFTGQVAWVSSSARDHGLIIRGQGALRSWQLSGSYRQVITSGNSSPTARDGYDPFPREFRQARLSAQQVTDWGRYGMRGFYREDSSGNETWFAGSHIDFAILKDDDWRLNLELRGEVGSDRESSFIGVRLSRSFKGRGIEAWRTHVSARANSDLLNIRSTGERTVRRVLEAESRAYRRRSQNERVSVFGGIRQDEIFGLKAGAELQNAVLSARVDARRTFQNQNSVSLDLQSGLVLGPHGVAVTSSSAESGVQLAVTGSGADRFAVQIDGQKRGETFARGPGFAPLAAFDFHDVAIAPITSSEVEYDQSADRLIAYPGNIISLRRTVRPISIFIGQLVDERGDAITKMALSREGVVGATDEAGFFQIDGATGDALSVQLADGVECTFILPEVSKDGADYVDAGVLTCHPTAPSNVVQ